MTRPAHTVPSSFEDITLNAPPRKSLTAYEEGYSGAIRMQDVVMMAREQRKSLKKQSTIETILRSTLQEEVVEDDKAEKALESHRARTITRSSSVSSMDNKSLQFRARRFYQDYRTRLAVSILIMLSFIQEVVKCQIDPASTLAPEVWFGFDITFLVLFTIELLVNLFAYWNRRVFWTSGFNWLDIVVVSSGIANAVIETRVGVIDRIVNTTEVVGPDTAATEVWQVMRALRALRVLRIFRRVHSLHTAFLTLSRAIYRCLTTIGLSAFVMTLYALIGTTIFRTASVDVGLTSRGYEYGEEYWGSFVRAFWTLFQVWTLESWSEAVARPLVFSNQQHIVVVAVFFFITCALPHHATNHTHKHRKN